MQNEELILATLMQIKQDLGQVSSKVDAFTNDLKKHIEEDEKLADRVSEIENNQNKTKWFMAGVSATVSIVFSVLTALFNK